VLDRIRQRISRPSAPVEQAPVGPRRNAILLHDTASTPTENWFPWLDTDLAWRGYDVWMPQLPESEQPNFGRYWETLRRHDYNARTVLVGHGSGAMSAFALVQRLPARIKIRALIAVAPVRRDVDGPNGGLFTEEYDWQKIAAQVGRIALLWAPNDPLVDEGEVKAMCEKLRIEPIEVAGAGHFDIETSPAFRRLPLVSELIP
jgi:pimeloyl-ACP methyl ester carboxylesterase